jgi:Ser/Thr protein kinase RdoA (MazF antagonist)
MKLHPDKQLEISKENLVDILNLYEFSDFTFTVFDGGIENTSIYIESFGTKYVLRIYCQDKKTDDDILIELDFQNYLRARGIPIPFFYRTVGSKELGIVEIAGRRWQVVLMEFKEGESTQTNPSSELIAQLAHTQANMHLLGIEFAEKTNRIKEPITHITGSIANRITTSPVQTKEVLEFIDRAKSFTYELNPLLPHGYNHLDLDFDGNVLVKENKLAAIIDFDDLKYSPVIMCLGFTLWNILDDNGLEGITAVFK